MFRLLLGALSAAVLFTPTAPMAHSWYPLSCCSNQDCEPVPGDGVTQLEGRYHVRYHSPRFGAIDEYVDSNDALQSEDGNFHACWHKTSMTTKSICFFVPLSM